MLQINVRCDVWNLFCVHFALWWHLSIGFILWYMCVRVCDVLAVCTFQFTMHTSQSVGIWIDTDSITNRGVGGVVADVRLYARAVSISKVGTSATHVIILRDESIAGQRESLIIRMNSKVIWTHRAHLAWQCYSSVYVFFVFHAILARSRAFDYWLIVYPREEEEEKKQTLLTIYGNTQIFHVFFCFKYFSVVSVEYVQCMRFAAMFAIVVVLTTLNRIVYLAKYYYGIEKETERKNHSEKNKNRGSHTHT